MATLTKSIGTVTLAGAAEKVTLPAFYGWVWVKNMSDSDIFAGLSADISEGADGVMTIPSGECGRINMDGSRVFYLLGTGNVQIVGQNYADCPFKVGAKGGEVPAAVAIGDNLLINPDFKVNQKGITSVGTPGGTGSFVYTVDRWAIDDGGSVVVNSDGTLTVKGTISQKLENAVGDNVTASLGVVSGTATAVYDSAAKKFSITGDNAVISWAKLEYGSIATPFVAPNPATELVKCQRYYYCIRNQSETAAQLLGMGYAQSTAELNAIIQFPTCMRTPPTVKAFNFSGDSVLYSKNGVSTASAVSAATRNGCMKPFNAITIKCTGSFDASAMYQVYLEKSAYIEFDAEL